MTPRELEEYRTLRDTIRQRGTTRIWVFLAGLTAWAALTVATAALAALPIATLLPLLILAAAFEAVFSLHVGVERIGRYVQVFFEDDSTPGLADQRDSLEPAPKTPGAGERDWHPANVETGATRSRTEEGPREVRKWEHVAMTFGRPLAGSNMDPLFAMFFMLATVLNFVPVLLAEPIRIEVIVVGTAHLLLIGRILAARRVASRQRAADLERFQQLKHRT
jgi:hypothetical protein